MKIVVTSPKSSKAAAGAKAEECEEEEADPLHSSPSLLEANLHNPIMRKAKNKGDVKQHHGSKKKTGAKKKKA